MFKLSHSSCIRSSLIFLVILLLPSCASVRQGASVDAPIRVETDKGKIRGARYKLAKPQDWNKKILLVAPGWRPPDSRLSVDLETTAPFELALLEEGWLVATTSYRRTGLIIEDGIEDLQKLVRRIEKHHGKAEMLVIEGSSMGGAIGVLIAEGNYFPQRLNVGVLAYGVGLEEPGEAGPLPLTHRPSHPLLLMSNRSEWGSPLSYVRQAPWNIDRPALWYLERDGHVNLNSDERLKAVAAMDRWLLLGERPEGGPPFGLDVTVDLSDRRSRAHELPDGYRVQITRIDPIFGNVDTDMVKTDFEWLRMHHEAGFIVKSGGSTYVHFGETYSDVAPGEMVAFLSAEGYVCIAKNMGSAAKDLRCSAGDDLDCTIFVPDEKADTTIKRSPPRLR